MSEELTELKEHAEHGKENPALAPVSVTMAILAVLVAVVTLLGHRAHTEEVALGKLREKYSGEAARYRDDQKEIEDKARELEAEVATERNRADRYDLAEVFLEVGLVITSITLLSGRRTFWLAGVLLGLIGIVLAATAFLVH